MYDLITSSLLFLALVPGVIVSIGSGITAAVVHAVVFYVIQRFLSQYVPWWIVWAAVLVVVAVKFFGTSPYSTSSGY
jgi:hypothetical protein